MAKKQNQKNKLQRTAITSSEAIGVFERAFRTRNPDEVEQLLRDMLNVQVAAVDSKQKAEEAISKGKMLKTITVPYRVFLGKVKAILGQRDFEEKEPGIYSLEPNPILDDLRFVLVLSPVYSSEVVRPGKTYVLLSKLSGYSSTEGLTFAGPGEPTGFEDQPDADYREKYGAGRFQTWQDHVWGVWKHSERLAEMYHPFVKGWANRVLGAQLKGDNDKDQLDNFTDTVIWEMRVAVLFHDIGKLRREWQKVVWENEEKIRGERIDPEECGKFIARTSPIEKEEIRKLLKKPQRHAVFAYPFLRAFLKYLWDDFRFLDAIALASARHHSLKVLGVLEREQFNLGNDVNEFLKSWLPKILNDEDHKALLDALEVAIESTSNGSEADEPPSPSDDFYFLYCLTNRMVKVCDWEDAGGQMIELSNLT